MEHLDWQMELEMGHHEGQNRDHHVIQMVQKLKVHFLFELKHEHQFHKYAIQMMPEGEVVDDHKMQLDQNKAQ